MKALGIAIIAAAALMTTPAMAQDFSGPRIGVSVGVAGDKVADADSTTYGVNVGYDVQATEGVVAGVTAEYQRNFDTSEGREWAVTARVGTPIAKSALVYATAGYTNIGAFGFNLDGYRVGGGVEAKLSDRVYANVEHRYSEYDFGLKGHQTLVGVGFRF